MAFHFLILALVLQMSFFPANASCPAVEQCLAAKTCPLLPLPKSSLQASVAPEGFNVTILRPGVYSWTEGLYFSLILYKDRHLTLVDFPFRASAFKGSEYLLNTATRQIIGCERPRTIDMVYGHRHIDHIGGSTAFSKFIKTKFPGVKINVWGTMDSVSFLSRDSMFNIPKPTVIVGHNGKTIDIAEDLNLELTILGGHTQSDLVAHIPPGTDGGGIVHFVDFVTPGFVPFLDFAVTIDLGRYIAAQEELLKFDFEMFSPGHGRIGTASDVRVNVEYTRDVIKFAVEALSELTPQKLAEAGVGLVADPKAVQFGNTAWVSKVRVDLVASSCVRKLIGKCGCLLAAVDVWGPSHCKEALIFSTIETE